MVLIALNRPDRAQRVTVLAFTRNMAATSAGVSNLSASAWSFDIATPSLSSQGSTGFVTDKLIGRLPPEFRNSVGPPQRGVLGPPAGPRSDVRAVPDALYSHPPEVGRGH